MKPRIAYIGILALAGLPVLAQAAPAMPPQLSSVTPNAGLPGGIVRLNGTHFETSPSGKQVILKHSRGETRMLVRSWHERSIQVVVPNVPAGAAKIFIRSVFKGKSVTSRTIPFTVRPGLKQIGHGIGTSPSRPLVRQPIKMAPTGQGTAQCPDPAANRIEFRIVSKTSQFAGRVMITGVIKNLGGPYQSGANQQQMHLYEGTRLVAHVPFGNLTPGQEARVSYQRNWNSSSPAEGEFPPTYKLMIVYDPDITLDGNKQNDDCRNNNTMTRSGTGINALFR